MSVFALAQIWRQESEAEKCQSSFLGGALKKSITLFQSLSLPPTSLPQAPFQSGTGPAGDRKPLSVVGLPDQAPGQVLTIHVSLIFTGALGSQDHLREVASCVKVMGLVSGRAGAPVSLSPEPTLSRLPPKLSLLSQDQLRVL